MRGGYGAGGERAVRSAGAGWMGYDDSDPLSPEQELLTFAKDYAVKAFEGIH